MANPIARAAALAGAVALCGPLTAWSQTVESLTIAGAPPASVKAGQTYTFTPHAVAAGPAIPHFEIQNQPPWASFGWSGQLTGVPAATDEGTFSNIVISIVAGDARASLPGFSITVQAANSVAAPATISWEPPATNSDGSALTDLAGYRIYFGNTRSQLAPILSLNTAGMTDYVLEGLRPGVHYFAMTAVNSAGIESRLSAVVEATLY
jgi:hypothetical protein